MPCNPPINITTEALSHSTINVTWVLPLCENGTIIYIYYQELDCDACDEWETFGIAYDEDRVNSTMNTTLRFLKTATAYKGYILQSTLKGTGPPGEKFQFRTLVKRKYHHFFQTSITN